MKRGAMHTLVAKSRKPSSQRPRTCSRNRPRSNSRKSWLQKHREPKQRDMSSRLGVSSFLLSANLRTVPRDSRKDGAVVAAHFAAFSCCFHLARSRELGLNEPLALSGTCNFFCTAESYRHGQEYVPANAGFGRHSGSQSGAGKLQSPERADFTVPDAGSFPTRGLVSLGCRRFSTGKTAQPPDFVGCRCRLVSVVYPHGSRNVHQCLDRRLHQSAFRRGKG